MRMNKNEDEKLVLGGATILLNLGYGSTPSVFMKQMIFASSSLHECAMFSFYMGC